MRRTTGVLALIALALILAACAQEGDQQTYPNGMSELLAASGPGGWITANLAFELEGVETDRHPYAEEHTADFLRSEFDLRTAGGHRLRAVGLVWHADNDHIGPDVEPVGQLVIRGALYTRTGFRAIRATAELSLKIPGGDTVPAHAALFIIGPDVEFEDSDAPPFDVTTIRPDVNLPYPTGAVVPYSAVSGAGAFAGLLLGDVPSSQYANQEVNYAYVTEKWTTSLGSVHVLKGITGASGVSRPIVGVAVDLIEAEVSGNVVLLCENCIDQQRDVAIVVSSEGFTATDDLWLKLPYLQGAPYWASGRAALPMGEPNCKDVLEFGGRAVWAANLYYRTHVELVTGAQLALVGKAVTVHLPGSPEHSAAILRLHDAEQGAWDTALSILKHLEELSCL
ncbi:MAG: hypothetical protein KF813_01280 [Trueperaceae bacterium]|nr:hypothetical protein [Trueperaceae bacterium]